MKAIIILLLLALVIPAMAFTPEPTCWPPEEWREEYNEWFTWQCELQRQYTAETGYGLGAYLDFSQWAEMRAVNAPYWWKPVGEYRVFYTHLFVEAYA